MKENNQEKKTNSAKKLSSLTSLLKKGGYILPISENDIEEYDKTYIKTDIILPPDVDNPDFLFRKSESDDKEKQNKVFSERKEITKPKAKSKVVSMRNPTNVDYYRRTVLAAEIVY